jgi:hypothetical protein
MKFKKDAEGDTVRELEFTDVDGDHLNATVYTDEDFLLVLHAEQGVSFTRKEARKFALAVLKETLR